MNQMHKKKEEIYLLLINQNKKSTLKQKFLDKWK